MRGERGKTDAAETCAKLRRVLEQSELRRGCVCGAVDLDQIKYAGHLSHIRNRIWSLLSDLLAQNADIPRHSTQMLMSVFC